MSLRPIDVRMIFVTTVSLSKFEKLMGRSALTK